MTTDMISTESKMTKKLGEKVGCKAAFTCPLCYAQSVTHLKANQVKIISQNLVLKRKRIISIESK